MRPATIEKLSKLGFQKYRALDQSVEVGFTLQTGLWLSAAYFEFLHYRQPEQSLFTYPFLHADGQTWEGCVSEFWHIAPHNDSLADLSCYRSAIRTISS